MLYDKDIRDPLFEFLEDTYGKVRIIEEKTMGKSRADVVMVTEGALFGIEIKSDADTYARLARQVKDYDQFFDYNYVVVGTSHALHIEEHVPEYWGIITVEENTGEAEEKQAMPDFYILRHPQKNPKMDWKKKIGILWRPELAHIQEINEMPKYREKSKAFVTAKILEKIPAELLTVQVSEELFERDYQEMLAKIEAFRKEEALKRAAAKPRRRRRRGKRKTAFFSE